MTCDTCKKSYTGSCKSCGELIYVGRLSPSDPAGSMADALDELHRAMDFYDKVKASSGDERTAVGTDHYEWMESAVRKVLASR